MAKEGKWGTEDGGGGGRGAGGGFGENWHFEMDVNGQ